MTSNDRIMTSTENTKRIDNVFNFDLSKYEDSEMKISHHSYKIIENEN